MMYNEKYIFMYHINIYCHYISSYVIINKYCYYTSSRITRYILLFMTANIFITHCLV